MRKMKTIRINALKSTIKTAIVTAALAMSTQFANSQNLQSFLKGCYPLDCDKAVNSATTGSTYDALSFPGVSCTSGHTGVASTAYYFDGAPTTHIELDGTGANQELKPTGNFSWSGWINVDNITGSDQYFLYTSNGCPGSLYTEAYSFLVNSSGNLEVRKADGTCAAGSNVSLQSTVAISPGQWYHVGCVINTTSIEIYINGVLDISTTFATNNWGYNSNYNVYLGNTNNPNVTGGFAGSMDNVRFYAKTLSAAEFYALYKLDPSCRDCGLATYQANLEACYTLDCNLTNTAPTSTASPSLNGTASSVTCATGHTSGTLTAYAFGGSASSYISLPNDSRLKPSAITVACWVKIDQLQTAEYIVFCHNGCTFYHEGYTIVGHASGNNVYYEAAKSGDCVGSSQISVNSSAAPSSTNNWQCVVAYFDANGVKLWVDGVGYSQSGGTTLLYGSSPIYLGGTNVSFNYPLNGRIDNLKFWSKELTTDEVQFLCDQDVGCDDWCGNEFRPANSTGLNKLSNEPQNNIAVYPNPSATGKFNIRNSNGQRIEVSDISGRMISFTSSKVDEKTIEITLPEQSLGIYFIKLYDLKGNNTRTQKIVIQK
jgi:hypothetical protein